jgi:peptidoglycan/xylan/chitin deacetylase (PgdA/CDA1 family)
MMSPYSQLLGPFPRRTDTADKVIALTFDDGPNDPYTSQIADLLAQAGIRATFFQVGHCMQRCPDVTARLVGDGPCHRKPSHSHRVTRCRHTEAHRAETLAGPHTLTVVIGRAPALYRPPWLIRTPTLPAVLQRGGLSPISGEFCHAFEVIQPHVALASRHNRAGGLTEGRAGSKVWRNGGAVPSTGRPNVRLSAYPSR